MKKLVLVFLLFCSFINAQSLVELRGYLQKGENSEKWHQSYGGGLWINALNTLTGRVTYFKSIGDEHARIAFGLGFGF